MARAFRVPGRVNLIGEHTDYSGGLVLPAAIDRFVTVSCEPMDGAVRLSSERHARTVEVPADGRSPEELAGFGRYVAAVVAELAALGRPPIGLAGRISSDLPVGVGLGSSAALEVAVALALSAVADFELEPLELAEACQRAEDRAVGVRCGIMDQATAVLGRADHAVFLDCGTLEHALVPLPRDFALVIAESGLSRQLEHSGYARRQEELEAALAALGARRPSEIDPDEVEDLIAAAGLDPVPARRLRHVVSENARVRGVVDALTRPEGIDRKALARLLAAGHASLRDDFELSTPELDLLVELALDAGAFAARMTGGGFGGAVLALVELERADAVGRAVAEAYSVRGGPPSPRVHVCRAAEGAGEMA